MTVLAVDNTTNDPGPEGFPQLRNGTYDTKEVLTIASLEHRHATSSGSVRLYFSGGEGNWYRQSGTTGDTLTSFNTWGLRAREEMRLGAVAKWCRHRLRRVAGNVDFMPTNRPASSFRVRRSACFRPAP